MGRPLTVFTTGTVTLVVVVIYQTGLSRISMVIMGRMGTTFLPRPLWNFTDVGETIRSKPPTRALVDEIAWRSPHFVNYPSDPSAWPHNV